MTTVLVINAGFEPLHRVSLEHAVKMLVRQVAVVHEADEDETFGPFPRPKVLRLVRYVKMAWKYRRTGRMGFSREGVKMRDGYRCAYCGRPGNTIDHVHPQSRGGGTTWENCVTACQPCNQRKADRTPAEAGMKLRFDPYVPTSLPRLADVM